MQEKIIGLEGENTVNAVDVSPDSTRFATGTDKVASVWNVTSGERLLGPLKHHMFVTGIRFSPTTGNHIATACFGGSIQIFDSHTGDKLVTINTDMPRWIAVTPLAWSSDAQQIFAASHNTIKSFDTSTGSQLAESQILHHGNNDVASIALAANNRFIATSAERSILFLDTSTLTRIGPVIEDSKGIGSIAISADSNHLVTGRGDGKIIIRDLSKILPNSYGPFRVRICAFMISAFQMIPISSPMVINYIGTYS